MNPGKFWWQYFCAGWTWWIGQNNIVKKRKQYKIKLIQWFLQDIMKDKMITFFMSMPSKRCESAKRWVSISIKSINFIFFNYEPWYDIPLRIFQTIHFTCYLHILSTRRVEYFSRPIILFFSICLKCSRLLKTSHTELYHQK